MEGGRCKLVRLFGGRTAEWFIASPPTGRRPGPEEEEGREMEDNHSGSSICPEEATLEGRGVWLAGRLVGGGWSAWREEEGPGRETVVGGREGKVADEHWPGPPCRLERMARPTESVRRSSFLVGPSVRPSLLLLLL